MKTVYILTLTNKHDITIGQNNIEGVFVSEAAAEKFRDVTGPYDNFNDDSWAFDIEEWVVEE